MGRTFGQFSSGWWWRERWRSRVVSMNKFEAKFEDNFLQESWHKKKRKTRNRQTVGRWHEKKEGEARNGKTASLVIWGERKRTHISNCVWFVCAGDLLDRHHTHTHTHTLKFPYTPGQLFLSSKTFELAKKLYSERSSYWKLPNIHACKGTHTLRTRSKSDLIVW